LGSDRADSSCGFESIEARKADVQQNQVGLESFGFLNRDQPIPCFADDSQHRECRGFRDDPTENIAKWSTIIHD
jgi:hypothetical protein